MKFLEQKRLWVALIVMYFVIYAAGFFIYSVTRTKPAEAAAWYNNSWSWRKQITLNESQIPGSSDLTNFPVLINITDAALQANAQADGDDILFTAGDAVTKLNHEIESYNSGTGALVAWVSVPTLSATTNTNIYMYYGNAGAANQQNAAGVWSAASINMVHHLEETGAPPAQYLDSTSNDIDSNAIDFTNGSAPTAAGLANGAVAFNNDIGISFPDNNAHTPAGDFSVSAWINPSAAGAPATRYMIQKTNAFDLRYNPAAATFTYLFKPNALTARQLVSDVTAGAGNWIYVTGQKEGNTLYMYINGVRQTATNNAGGVALQNSAAIMYFGSNNTASRLVETMDEVRIAATFRTPEWLQAEYNNMTAPGSFHTVGSAEAGPVVTFVGLGTAATSLPRAANQYVGGGYAASLSIGSASITQIVLTESGSINGINNINNVKLYYEYDTSAPYNCSGHTFDGNERKFGSTATGGFSADNGTATITSTSGITISDSQTACFFPVLDFENNFAGTETFVISINNPSTDVTANAPVITNTSVQPSGTGNVNGSLALNRTWLNFRHRKVINIDDTDVAGTDDHYMFPVLISITDADLQADAQSDGDDIVFTNTYGVRLDHEIESYNSGTGSLIAWVEVPHLYYNAPTPIVMYYGNAYVASQQNVEGTWDALHGGDYALVHHLEESAPLSTGYNDSTSNNNDSSALDIDNGSGPTAGLIGTGYQSNTNDLGITIPDSTTLEQDPLTISAWVQTSTSAPMFVLLKNLNGFSLSVDGTGNAYFSYEASLGISSTVINSGNWKHLTLVKSAPGSNAGIILYVDGVLASGGLTNPVAASSTHLQIGSNNSTAYFIGKIDEVRVSNKTLSQEWIQTEYNNQSNPSGFLASISSEETRSNSAPSVLSVVLNSGSAIALTEGTTTNVSFTASIVDTDGYLDIGAASGKVYRSGVTSGCSADPNNCYSVASCSLSGCSGNSCTATCTASIRHFAQPTDAGTYSAEDYQAQVTAIDIFDVNTSAGTASGVELQSLVALDVAPSIDFGTVTPGANTDIVNTSLVVRNTGNVSIDSDINGGSICMDYPTCATPYIPVENLKYSLSPFDYDLAGTPLSTIAANLDISLPKQTAVGVNSETTLYWGVNVPFGLINGVYNSSGTIVAKQDS